MKSVAALLFAAPLASAFVAPSASSTRAVTKSTLNMEFAGGMVGGEGPEPTSKNFDPLGLAEKNPDRLKFYREAEIKHGRIAMLATVGLIVPSIVRLPGDIYQGGSVVDAHNKAVESGSLLQVLIWASVLELVSIPTVLNMNESDREPGNFAFDPLGFGKDAAKKKQLQIKELKNGRLAMLAFSGMITQAALTGHDFPFLY